MSSRPRWGPAFVEALPVGKFHGIGPTTSARLNSLGLQTGLDMRKQTMESLSDAFIAMPGGFGTLDELCEIVTWAQLGIHSKPVGLLDAGGFFGPFLAFLRGAVADGFIRAEHLDRIKVSSDPAALLDMLFAG